MYKTIEYKAKNHTFKELKEAFAKHSRTCYEWKNQLKEMGSLKTNYQEMRNRKIDKNKFKKAVEEKPDAYLSELACSPQAVFSALKKMNITYKKRHLLTQKNLKSKEKNLMK